MSEDTNKETNVADTLNEIFDDDPAKKPGKERLPNTRKNVRRHLRKRPERRRRQRLNRRKRTVNLRKTPKLVS